MKKKKIADIIIDPETSILVAIKRMDDLERKLFLVMEKEKFVGLVSIGDIQRSLIKSQDFSVPVGKILRENITVAKSHQSEADIKKMMLLHRTEFMPVLDKEDRLVDVLFWDELFEEERQIEKELSLIHI